MANNTVKIEPINEWLDEQEVVTIGEEPELPTNISVDIFEISEETGSDATYIDDLFDDVSEYLSSKYGFCFNGCKITATVDITDIEWDTTE